MGIDKTCLGLPRWHQSANARDIRDAGSIPGMGRSPAGGHGSPLQNSCLENPMGRGTWWATVHSIAKSQTRLKQLSKTYLKHKDTLNQCPSEW